MSSPRVKRTYSGHSRSFLVSLSKDDNLSEPESYSSLRMRWGVDSEEHDSVLPPNMMNNLKSITELRSKGESRRFLDQAGYLLEGMDPSNSSALKRSRFALLIESLPSLAHRPQCLRHNSPPLRPRIRSQGQGSRLLPQILARLSESRRRYRPGQGDSYYPPAFPVQTLSYRSSISSSYSSSPSSLAIQIPSSICYPTTIPAKTISPVSSSSFSGLQPTRTPSLWSPIPLQQIETFDASA